MGVLILPPIFQMQVMGLPPITSQTKYAEK